MYGSILKAILDDTRKSFSITLGVPDPFQSTYSLPN